MTLAKMMKAVKSQTQTNKSSCSSELLFCCTKLTPCKDVIDQGQWVQTSDEIRSEKEQKVTCLIYKFMLFMRV